MLSAVKPDGHQLIFRMRQVLFISYDGLTDPLGQSQILPYVLGLTRHGYEFTILSCEKPGRYEQRKHVIDEIIRQYPVNWVPLPYHKNPPVLSSVYDYQNMWRMAKKLWAKRKFELVHTRSGIPTLVALKLKKQFGVKYLNDVRGFWADERVDGDLWDLGNPVYKKVYDYFKAKEAECLRINDYTTCLTYKAKEQIQSWKLLKNPENITVIPCSVDLKLFDPETIDPAKAGQLKQKLGITVEDTVVSYIGSVGTWYMVDEMMQLFKVFMQRDPKVKFLMLINGSEHEKVLDYIHKYGIPESRVILTEISRKEVPLYLSCSHFSVFFIKPCFSKLSSSPTKHGEIMSMGLPLITNSGVGDVADIVNKYESGVVIGRFGEKDYEEAVDRLLSARFDKQRIRMGAEEFYSLEHALDRYAGVYQKILEA
jgi:glycosyltransferase involved in cell wall biosynthesis